MWPFKRKKKIIPDDPTNIGNLLHHMGALSSRELAHAVEIQHALDRQLGQILIAEQYVSAHDVEVALEVQELLRKGSELQAQTAMIRYRLEQRRAIVKRHKDVATRMEAVVGG